VLGFTQSKVTRFLGVLTFTQRTIHVVLANKTEVLRHDKPFPAVIKTIGDLLMARRKEASLTRQKLSETTGIPLHWLGRWERDRSFPSSAEWSKP
jgi:DNA-binding transcriptional regulator YiaG